MKIWPFDAYALASGGRHIESADLKRGVQVVEAIRKSAGDRIDIMIEDHGLWQLPPALTTADALTDLDIYWHEDSVVMRHLAGLGRALRPQVRSRTDVAIRRSSPLNSTIVSRDFLRHSSTGESAHGSRCGRNQQR